MRGLFVLLLPCLLMAEVGLEPVNVTGTDGHMQTYYRINTGSGYVFDGALAPVTAAPPLVSDTGVMWVDRNHRFGICQTTGISADGRHIFANWYLNAQRGDYYRALGNEVPLWESPGDFTWTWNGHNIGISSDASALSLSATAYTNEWSRSSGVPNWTYSHAAPAMAATACSRDGNRVVICEGGMLHWRVASTGVPVWDAAVPEPDRLQGLAVSDDASIVAVTVYDSCLVYEAGARRGAIPVGTSAAGTQYAAAMSGDGSIIVTGDFSGRCKLFRWDGASYVQRWSASVGTPWVAGLAVSRDGSRVACGTGYQNGKLCVFDSSSATPVMVYQNYGNVGSYVPSVALNDDGSRVAAASWGDTALTGTSRVFTVHNVGDTTPLVAITRNEEPGSMFTCDISADGQFATCGGKAVHANRMGNGGQVYAVIVGSSESTNVGVEAISSPTRHIQVGSPVTPVAVVRNYGDAAASVPTVLEIYNSADSMLYADSSETAIDPGEAAELTFDDFTPTTFDLYRFVFYTMLAGDGYAGDDTMVMPAKCYHDGKVDWIRPPGAEVTVGLPFAPAAQVRNTGSYPDSITRFIVIADSDGAVVYSDSSTSNLNPEDTLRVAFGTWTPPYVGHFTATTWTRVSNDFYPVNDTVGKEFDVTYEIMYDDGGAEAYFWVGRLDNDKFYVRFTPTIPPPFSVRHGRIMVNLANQVFDYVMVCPGSGNKPDTLQPLQVVTNVSTPVAPGWIDFDLDITRNDASDLWMIMHWPAGSPGMGVGADVTPPIDLRSYFSSNQDTFRLWSTADWMARLTQSPDVGIIGSGSVAPLRFGLTGAFPNPFGRATALEYELPVAAKVEIGIYDGTGRRVARPLDATAEPGRHRLTWNGMGSDGVPLAPGIYFARLRNSGTGATSVLKVALVR